MKRLALGLVLMLMVNAGCRADALSGADAAKQVGQAVTVKDTIAEVKMFAGGSEALDLGARYPHQTLTIYIPKNLVKSMPDYTEGQTITVTGTVTVYKGRPEIEVHDPGQVTAG